MVDIPAWATGFRPLVKESSRAAAERYFGSHYRNEEWSRQIAKMDEFRALKRYFVLNFDDPYSVGKQE